MRLFHLPLLLKVISLCLNVSLVSSFATFPVFTSSNRVYCAPPLAAARLTVSVDELEQNLTSSERSITSVVRTCGSSVVFVSSFLETSRLSSQRRTDASSKNNLPPGRSLGAGSGFIVDQRGYIVTNYHVIERAYVLQQMKQQYEETIGNITRAFGVENIMRQSRTMPSAQVYVRLDQSSQYQECRVVDVKPDLDIAVLKLSNTTSTLDPVEFGSSSSLLVGQSVVAIGNPFGLESSVTSGVVSALNRDISTSSSKISNCIQTDASINPGNSGGPLLNLGGQVIGVNTAIVTTSGSSAGVGFAIPSDKVEPVVSAIIRKDVARQVSIPWLGVSIVKPTVSLGERNWVASVVDDSPAARAGIQALSFSSEGRLQLGHCIVAIGGNDATTFQALQKELDGRNVGEQVALTLEDSQGERRVVYLKLEAMRM